MLLRFNYMTMNDDLKKESPIKFSNKDEISKAISVLTPFTRAGNPRWDQDQYPFAVKKVEELTKLL